MTNLPSGLPENVADSEHVVRFLTQSGHFNTTMAKPAAFLPNKSHETSVSRHGREPLADLKNIGKIAAGDRRLHGGAFVKADIIRETKLKVISDEPPNRHAVIRGWPTNADPEEQKAARLERALQIARSAELLLFEEAP